METWMSIDFGIAWNVEMGSCSFDVGEPEERVWITIRENDAYIKLKSFEINLLNAGDPL